MRIIAGVLFSSKVLIYSKVSQHIDIIACQFQMKTLYSIECILCMKDVHIILLSFVLNVHDDGPSARGCHTGGFQKFYFE